MNYRLFIVVAGLLAVRCHTFVHAGDWPMRGYDAGRGGCSPHALPTPLHLQWLRRLPPSRPAWPPHQAKLQFDVAPEPVVQGNRIFVPSTVTDTVTAYDTRTGREHWRFYADGPVRFAPVAHGGRVYFASDDGYLYCLHGDDGSLIWKFNGGPAERWIVGNHRLISSWPARGGPVVHDGRVYFAASIWPFMGIFIRALDAQTGRVIWTNSGNGMNYTVQPHGAPSFASVVPQGHLVAVGNRLIVPGGRSTPAVFDIHSGQLRYFQYEGKRGGHHVMANQEVFCVADQIYALSDGGHADTDAPALFDDRMLIFSGGEDSPIRAVSAADTLEKAMVTDRHGKQHEVWKFVRNELFQFQPVEGLPVKLYIKAGPHLYTGGQGKVAAFDVTGISGPGGAVKPVWSAPIEGSVWNMLAADDRLFVMTTDSRLYCFGAELAAARTYPLNATPVPAGPGRWADTAARILDSDAADEGYALALGVGSGRLIEQLLQQSKLHIVVLDPDAAKIADFRRKMQAAGWYGRRAAARAADPISSSLPPYLANLIVCEDPAAFGLDRGTAFVESVFRALRPYGGRASLELTSRQRRRLERQVRSVGLDGARVQAHGGLTHLVREGALPDTDNWTHQYANAGQTGVSKDKRVRAPLGLLWFGGPSHTGILPRHGHGPSPQVAGGRVLIEGRDILRAVDVYTGRLLWEARLPEVGKYYDNTGHFPGAGEIGSNYVSLPNRIYVVNGAAILELDAVTGSVIKQFGADEGTEPVHWGYISIWQDMLIATSSPVSVSGAGGDESKEAKPIASVDQLLTRTRFSSGSRRLVVYDRHTGERLWSRDARFNFRHNNIAVGAGKVFCIDTFSEAKRQALARRGLVVADEPALYALDIHSGRVLWSTTQEVFGTFLNYSEDRDTLVQGGSRYRDRAHDEVGRGVIAYRGRDGKVLWHEPEMEYTGPCLLWRDKILTNGDSGIAIDITNGKPTGWSFQRQYGCNTVAGSEYLLTFRSGAAGFLDLANDGGTGNIGGFRSGCTNNLIVADGVLNAPDYTRTCNCAYQNQSSLALIHMPEAEFWTFGAAARDGQIGINFGAPGDRRARNGTLWLDVPSVGGPSPSLTVTIEPSPQVFRLHASVVFDGDLKWVAASGIRGARRVILAVKEGKTYTVKLHLLEPDALAVGQRVFDVALQNKRVLRDFDIVKQTGGPRRATTQVFTTYADDAKIVIDLKPKTSRPAVLSGVEVIAVQDLR